MIKIISDIKDNIETGVIKIFRKKDL
jgi:hypothetical protein